MTILKYTSTVEELLHIKELQPQPGRNFVPDWYFKTPIYGDRDKEIVATKYGLSGDFKSKLKPGLRTVKRCPSFHEIFDEGLVVVSPCDVWIRLFNFDNDWEWESKLKNALDVEFHEHEQFRDPYGDKNIRAVFKLNLPWKFETPKGYSVRQFPMLYANNPDWTVAYGVVRTDIHNEINAQLLYTSDKDEILIKAGEPICYIVPYKRLDNKYKLITNKKEREKFLLKTRVNVYQVVSSFKSGYHKLKIK